MFLRHRCTVTLKVVDRPSTLIVIVAVPALWVVTKPSGDTEAVLAAPEVYVGVVMVASAGAMIGLI